MDFSSITSLISAIYNVPKLVAWAGYAGLAFIIFAETGLFFGFFFPGDSLLVTAGILAAAGQLNLLLLAIILIPSAIIGDAVGYTFGSRAGPLLYKRKDSFFFRRQHLISAKEFYDLHGGIAVFFARFVPVVRTFAPIVAGAAQMPYRKFAKYNIAGAAVWVTAALLAGYSLGKLVPDVDKYLLIIIVIVVLVSLIPIGYEWAKGRMKK
jgi:membrane-associated protein